jgi:hypothetical protein
MLLITIPNGITSIGKDVFKVNNELTEIKIKIINNCMIENFADAFDNYNNIDIITIP